MRLTLKSLFIPAALLIAWHGAKAMAEDRVLDEFEELQRMLGFVPHANLRAVHLDTQRRSSAAERSGAESAGTIIVCSI